MVLYQEKNTKVLARKKKCCDVSHGLYLHLDQYSFTQFPPAIGCGGATCSTLAPQQPDKH